MSIRPNVVPFASRAGGDDRTAWLAHLRDAMPAHRIAPVNELAEGERAAARVAIVADPDPADLAALPNLVWVQSLWAGVERLVAELPPAIGIARLVDPNLARVMAEAALAWTLALHRDMPRYARQQREHVWRAHEYRPPEDVTVGVLGLGALGRASASILARHGYRVLGWSRSAKAIEGVETHEGARGLGAVLAASDVLVLLVPLTDGTRGLLGADELGAIKPGAALVNFARGPVVDDAALLAALDEGRLSHAVLDVFDTEPLPPGSPFWDHPRVTVLPHVSAPTTKASAARIAADAIAAFERDGGTPPLVDRGRGY